ncbi:MAG: YidC/Oxa1 family membrane protein insertase [Blautia sp.]
MEASMKMMNNVMPLMSVVFCFTLPTGLGIYWVASAVVRIIQQLIVNKQIDKIDLDADDPEKRGEKQREA